MEKLKMFFMDNGITPRLKKYFPKDDLYFRCSCVFNSGDTCVDRFNLLHKYSSYNWYNFDTTPPKLTDKSYLDISVNHAQSIMKIHDKIAVLWSGGVDSTGIVAILLEAGMNPKNIDVVGTVSSLQEAPNFDTYFKRLGINYKEIQKDEYMYTSINNYTDASIILTGICNDQLWYRNASKLSSPDNLKYIKDNWRTQLINSYNYYGISSYVSNDIDIFEQYLKDLSMDCESFAEFGHMMNFCLHWEYVKHFYSLQTNNEINNRLINFYDNQELQNWSYTNRKYIAETAFLCNEGKTEYYKKDLKDLIYKYFPDEDYYKYKIKGDSLKIYKSEVELPFYPITIKTNKRTVFHKIKPIASEKLYAKRAFELLEEFKK
jgi:hypothetical protein